jgi:hypothetical protein
MSGTDLSAANLEGFDPTIVFSLDHAVMNKVKGLTEKQLRVCKTKGAII